MPVNCVDEEALNEERRIEIINRRNTMPNNTILITPEATLVAGKSMTPDNISIVLENGHSYDLDTVLLLLMKHDKKKTGKGPSFTMRTKRAITAFRQAMKETADTPK